MTESTPNAALGALQQELEEVLLRRARANRLQTLLQSTGSDLRRRETELSELRTQLDRERADVEQLEGLSFTTLLWTVLQRKDERRAKEQAELAAAQMKHDAAAADVQSLQAEQAQLSSELAGLTDLDSTYASLIARKEQLLLELGDERARTLLEMSDLVPRLRAEIKELEEATSAGESAERAVSEVLRALESAAGWGKWDLWAGGDVVSSSIKHSRLDDAKQAAQAANTQLDRFRRELQDTQLTVDSVECVELNELDRFIDVFLDNFFTDWNVQNGINRSIEATEHALAQVMSARVILEQRVREAQARISQTERERTRLLEADL